MVALSSMLRHKAHTHKSCLLICHSTTLRAVEATEVEPLQRFGLRDKAQL